ncbi:MAG TPA: class I tRNA ligase family protein, partial [Ferruginibacter sp.]|nr:class I tRNA ligase family protein [Ferruginibacter sp.]
APKNGFFFYSADAIPEHFSSPNFFVDQIHIPISQIDNSVLDLNGYLKYMNGQVDSFFFITKDGFFREGENFDFNSNELKSLKFKTSSLNEKMSKSKLNTENPDELVVKYGADTFRMYEMFLGPVEQSKPWDTKGIEGVHRFLRKLWRLFNDDIKGKVWTDEKATDAELKILHRTIKKIEEDTERFSFNTAVSTFMICVNELAEAKCSKKEILQQVLILLTPYAPHIAEELWHQLGNTTNIIDAAYPIFDGKYLIESDKEYPISINGKMRTNINISLSASQEEVEKIVLANEHIQKWTEGKTPKKIIFVKGKMVNIVV